MLSRVRSALIKHLTPVSSRLDEETSKNSNSSSGQDREPEQKNQQFQKFTSSPVETPAPAQQSPSSPPKLVLIQNPQANERPIGDPPPTQSWLELFALFKGERTTLLNWFGKKLYQTSLKRQKELGKSKQGIMLDHKAE